MREGQVLVSVPMQVQIGDFDGDGRALLAEGWMANMGRGRTVTE